MLSIKSVQFSSRWYLGARESPYQRSLVMFSHVYEWKKREKKPTAQHPSPAGDVHLCAKETVLLSRQNQHILYYICAPQRQNRDILYCITINKSSLVIFSKLYNWKMKGEKNHCTIAKPHQEKYTYAQNKRYQDKISVTILYIKHHSKIFSYVLPFL